MIKVMIVDDEELFLESLKIVIESQAPDISVVAHATEGTESVRFARETRPDVVLMDIRMPGVGGIEASRRILSYLPSTHILMLTTFDDEQFIYDSLSSGATGYVLKDIGSVKLILAIRAVHEGVMSISPSVAKRLVDRHRHTGATVIGSRFNLDELTRRERDVIGLLADGYSNRDIADKLNLAPQTVKNYVSSIYFKLDLSDRSALLKKQPRDAD